MPQKDKGYLFLLNNADMLLFFKLVLAFYDVVWNCVRIKVKNIIYSVSSLNFLKNGEGEKIKHTLYY